METSLNPHVLGVPVEIGLIEKELGKLWEENAQTKTRASLINLVLYTESPSDIENNTRLIAEIASKHAFRALVVFAHPSAPGSRAQAWINAHCHTIAKGKLQICSEQITFQLDGKAVHALPNIVFSHLDTDLPLCLWWQTEFPKKLDLSLWKMVDRVIFDSSTWNNVKTQMAHIKGIFEGEENRFVLCDLNWTRLLNIRFAVASLFDHASALPYLSKIKQLRLRYAPGSRTSALLLVGWLASRFEWKLETLSPSFLSPRGTSILLDLEEQPGAAISLCHFEAEDASFQVRREEGSAFYQMGMKGAGLPSAEHLFSAGKETLVDVLVEELGRSGKHPDYYSALKIIFPLLAS